MTRDHDSKRAIRARMKVTGERYTVARSALVAPGQPRASGPETTASQGGAVASVHTDLAGELDERGFAVIRSFASPDEVAGLTAVVDEVVTETLSRKQEEARQRREAGEIRIDVWHPGEAGFVFGVLSDRPEVQWLLHDPRLLDIARQASGPGAALRKVGALASLPGFGHQGLHPDHEGVSRSIGAWGAIAFVLMLSPHGADTGTIRVVPGSHRSPPELADEVGSAMRPHPGEVRIEAEPGDVFVYSGHLWKSATFNGGHEPLKSLLVAGPHDVGWGG